MTSNKIVKNRSSAITKFQSQKSGLAENNRLSRITFKDKIINPKKNQRSGMAEHNFYEKATFKQ
jgi:hypothetical protein